ncbi:hypothetical protein [Enterobacter kobei]|uniref:hypothetical protein n=1 Tax=Enterobacter kobei TaxID=208224 RepID=UPI0032AFA865
MKNQIYNRHSIYEIIRNHYIKNFPYTIQFDALNAINEHISLIIDNASIQKNEDKKYIFINNNNTNKENDDPFESTERNLAAYLSRSSGIEALFQDVNALQKWLLQSGFISSGIATEKMLLTNKL